MIKDKQTPPAFPEAATASSSQKADKDRNKSKKMEKEAAENPHLSDKTDLAPSEDSQSLSKTEPLEKVLNEMSEEIVNLLSKYAHLVSTRAALDSSHVRELDEILKEARAIENHLKQKREMLKQRFTFLANTLQS
ncbi:PREDICTED: testis-expressed sequence 12 protein isoform X1 [Ficedula albicollis]|uniref:Testis expressed 12 n=1 Tax=Ficedula albicollis TaxID=59894 RepID=A0A803VNY1_FICAL|nr:PREDICTED: testis-expressed sequence 12 protein isoform X1 [Ficedula albicollis]